MLLFGKLILSPNKVTMNINLIQAEVDKVAQSTFAKKSDKQLMSYEIMSEIYRNKHKGVQPSSLSNFNHRKYRVCKLTQAQVAEIRSKYNPHVYGKLKLSKEYGVSAPLILKIVRGLIWK